MSFATVSSMGLRKQYLRHNFFLRPYARLHTKSIARLGPCLCRYQPRLGGGLLAQTSVICSFRTFESPFHPDMYEVRILPALYFRRPVLRIIGEPSRFSSVAWMLRNLYLL